MKIKKLFETTSRIRPYVVQGVIWHGQVFFFTFYIQDALGISAQHMSMSTKFALGHCQPREGRRWREFDMENLPAFGTATVDG